MQQSFNSNKKNNGDWSVLKQAIIRRIFYNDRGGINGMLVRRGNRLFKVIGRDIRFEEIPNFSGSTGRHGKYPEKLQNNGNGYRRSSSNYKTKRRFPRGSGNTFSHTS